MDVWLHVFFGFQTFFFFFQVKSKRVLLGAQGWSFAELCCLQNYVLCSPVRIWKYMFMFIYFDTEKEHILHINPFCSILKGSLMQKIHGHGSKSCGWDYPSINPLECIWFGELHHTQVLKPPRQNTLGDLGAKWLSDDCRLTSQSHPQGMAMCSRFAAPSEQQVAVFPRRQGMEEAMNLLNTLICLQHLRWE